MNVSVGQEVCGRRSDCAYAAAVGIKPASIIRGHSTAVAESWDDTILSGPNLSRLFFNFLLSFGCRGRGCAVIIIRAAFQAHGPRISLDLS